MFSSVPVCPLPLEKAKSKPVSHLSFLFTPYPYLHTPKRAASVRPYGLLTCGKTSGCLFSFSLSAVLQFSTSWGSVQRKGKKGPPELFINTNKTFYMISLNYYPSLWKDTH